MARSSHHCALLTVCLLQQTVTIPAAVYELFADPPIELLAKVSHFDCPFLPSDDPNGSGSPPCGRGFVAQNAVQELHPAAMSLDPTSSANQ
jgi:hypothetical protein